MEDISPTKDSAPLDLVPPEHILPNGDNKPFDEYCEETDTHCPLAELLEELQEI